MAPVVRPPPACAETFAAAAAAAVAVAADRYRALRNLFGLIPGFVNYAYVVRPHRHLCGKGNKIGIKTVSIRQGFRIRILMRVRLRIRVSPFSLNC
jgi:hypothetical protein